MRSSATATNATEFSEAVFADDAEFRAWYDSVLPRVYRYVFHRCGRDRSLAEELTQETFVAAIHSRRRFSGRGDAVSWLIGIARHRLADHYRRLERQERGARNLIVLLVQGVHPRGDRDHWPRHAGDDDEHLQPRHRGPESGTQPARMDRLLGGGD